MKKIVTYLDCCEECPNKYYTGTAKGEILRMVCKKEDKVIAKINRRKYIRTPIPDWCPLEDADV